MKPISSKHIVFIVISVVFLIVQDISAVFNTDKSEPEVTSKLNALPGQTRAMWVFASSEIIDNNARARLVDHSADSGITDLYASVYQPTPNSSGRRMFEDAIVADLISRAHLKNQKVWGAYGSPDSHILGCAPTSHPMQRMAEVVAYNNSRTASERFDGVVLDVEPPEPMSETDFQALLTYYQCVRDFLPPEIKLAAAIRFFWTSPVAFPAGGAVKPAYQHILDLDLDNVIVMGYRDFAGTANCAQGDGIICLDQDEINYSTSINKPGQVLVGLETLNPASAGLLDKETFFEEGQIKLSAVSKEVENHFSDRAGFGGFAIHNYKSAYLSGIPGWESPVVSSVVFFADFNFNAAAPYTTSGNIGTSTFSVTRSGVDWGARLHPTLFRLQLTNDAGAEENLPGWVFAGTSTTNFESPYNPILGLNSGLVTWNFNMRQVRDNPAGFEDSTYGVAFILGTTSPNAASEGSGYAVVLGQSGAIDPIRLVKFTGGLRGTMTNLIVSNTEGLTDFGAEYLSVRVTFNPVTKQWELFLRNDGTTDFAKPNMGTLVSQGALMDSTYATMSLPYLGGYWQGFTQIQQTAFFDNLAVTIAPPLGPTAANAALGGRVKTVRGRGDSTTIVTLSGGGLPVPFVTKTNPFGYYRFKDLPVGQTYIVTVKSKRSNQDVVTQVVTLLGEVENIDFIIPAQ